MVHAKPVCKKHFDTHVKTKTDEANKGLHFIPEMLRGPILKANKLYMDIAEGLR